MKIISSPLGQAWIVLVISEWNMSRDIEGKAAVRRLLLSEETMNIHEALGELNRIADERFKRECGALKHTEMSIGSIAVVLSGATQFGSEADAAQRALIERARGELVYYLDCAFRDDCLEELPLPEFGYELSLGQNGQEGTINHPIPAAKIAVPQLPKMSCDYVVENRVTECGDAV